MPGSIEYLTLTSPFADPILSVSTETSSPARAVISPLVRRRLCSSVRLKLIRGSATKLRISEIWLPPEIRPSQPACFRLIAMILIM